MTQTSTAAPYGDSPEQRRAILRAERERYLNDVCPVSGTAAAYAWYDGALYCTRCGGSRPHPPEEVDA